MDCVDAQGRVWRHVAKEKHSPDWAQSKYSYKLRQHHPDILMRLAKGEPLVSIAQRYGCSYQAIQRIKKTHAKN